MGVSVERVGEIHRQWSQCMAHHSMVDCCEPEENGHENDGPRRGVDSEETDEAYFRDINTCHELLEGLSISKSFGVDVVGENVHRVVSDGKVDEREAYGCKAEDERGDDRVGDGNYTQVAKARI